MREEKRWKVVMEHARALQEDTTMTVQRYGRGDTYYSGDSVIRESEVT